MTTPIHQRKTIRDAVVARLVSANTAAGSRVYPTRVFPQRDTHPAAISVYTLSETVDPDSQNSSSRELYRDLKMVLDAVLRTPGTNIDDSMDALALEIERALHADETFGGACAWSLLDSTDLDFHDDGKGPIGLLRLTYSVRYFTYAPDSVDVTLPDYSGAGVTYTPNGAADPAQDVIDES